MYFWGTLAIAPPPLTNVLYCTRFFHSVAEFLTVWVYLYCIDGLNYTIASLKLKALFISVVVTPGE